MMPFATTPTMDAAASFDYVPAEMQIKNLHETIENLNEKNEYLQGQLDHVVPNMKKYIQLNKDLTVKRNALLTQIKSTRDKYSALEERHSALKKRLSELEKELDAHKSKGKGNKRAKPSKEAMDDDEEEMDEMAIEAERKKQFEAFVANDNAKLDALIASIINDIKNKLDHGADIDGRMVKDGWQELLSMWLYDNFEVCKNTATKDDVDASKMFFVRHYENGKKSKSPQKKSGRWVWKVFQSYRSVKLDGAPPVKVTLGIADCFD
jgi:hypothetical protein